VTAMSVSVRRSLAANGCSAVIPAKAGSKDAERR
jgi:hypothetical protein